jgi:hypothetical protein
MIKYRIYTPFEYSKIKTRNKTILEIAEDVCKFYKINKKSLIGKTQIAPTPDARVIFYHLCLANGIDKKTSLKFLNRNRTAYLHYELKLKNLKDLKIIYKKLL